MFDHVQGQDIFRDWAVEQSMGYVKEAPYSQRLGYFHMEKEEGQYRMSSN